jgi:hypothetical protein
MQRHLAQLHQSYGEHQGVRVARKHIGWYLQGRIDSAEARKGLMRADTAAEQFAILNSYFCQGPQHARKENIKPAIMPYHSHFSADVLQPRAGAGSG